jgi:hypothetical protein
MIVHQINRLIISAGEQRRLEAASAAGSEFAAAMVAGALERGAHEVDQICEELVRRGQILLSAGISEWPDGTLAGRYGFKHSLPAARTAAVKRRR